MSKLRRYFNSLSWGIVLLNGVMYCVYALGVALIVWIYIKIHSDLVSGMWPPPIDRLSNWAQIIIAYAAIFAIAQYAVTYADRADRKTKLVLELVKFFRETVLEKGSEIKLYIKKEKIKMPGIIYRKNTPAPTFTGEEFFRKIVPNQKELIEKYSQILEEDPVFEAMIIACLNSAEEFAIGILNTKSQDHLAVSSIKKPFVELMEQFSLPFYYQIGMTDDPFVYASRLYRYWKKDVGFVPNTKEDRVQRYEERVAEARKRNQ